MKNFILLLPIVFLLSCSVQKRKYQNGYYVNWNHKKTSADKLVSKKEETKKPETQSKSASEIQTNSQVKEKTLAHVDQTIPSLTNKKFSFLKTGEDSCDVIIFKDGSEVRAKVQEIGINEIKYKRCEAPSGPVYVSRKSDVFMIRYMNGTKEVIKSDPVANITPFEQQPISYKSNKYKKETHPLAPPALVAGIISVIAAYIGVFFLSSTSIVAPVIIIPLLVGIIAVVIASTASNRINEEPDVYKGKGMTTTAFIMGLVIACIYAMIGSVYLLNN